MKPSSSSAAQAIAGLIDSPPRVPMRDHFGRISAFAVRHVPSPAGNLRCRPSPLGNPSVMTGAPTPSPLLLNGGERRDDMLDPDDMRTRAQRCRELLRVAVRPEVKEQLREWADDFEEEAAALEGSRQRVGADAE
jgi:hypothetical protein